MQKPKQQLNPLLPQLLSQDNPFLTSNFDNSYLRTGYKNPLSLQASKIWSLCEIYLAESLLLWSGTQYLSAWRLRLLPAILCSQETSTELSSPLAGMRMKEIAEINHPSCPSAYLDLRLSKKFDFYSFS